MHLSVLMPVYNEYSTLEEILQRVLAVPLEKEVIVVDNCSTDGSRELIQEWIASGNWQTRKIDLTSEKDPDHISYRFEAVQIFPQYDHRKTDGTYPEVRSKTIIVQLRRARGY